MSTIIIHGTMAAAEDWYADSWYEGGFCQSLANAMINCSGYEDVWKVNDIPVNQVEQLNPDRSFWTGRMGQISQQNGHFFWSGDYAAVSRKMAGNDLVDYLNVLASITNEPLRIIAHSHGCNVVKHASANPGLNNNVYFDKAVFLACPHMTDAHSGEFLYRLDPRRFGRIGNFYSEKDPVVAKIANKLATASGWSYEVPDSCFQDYDPDARFLYEDYNMHVPPHITGTAVHSWLHGADMGYTVGQWLETGQL